jgi:hypothetical protein
MRIFPLTLFGLALAQPALAQRVDTRRNDLVQRAAGVATCRFNAVPELELKEYPAGASFALLHKSAQGVPPGARLDLVMRYSPEQGHSFNVRRQLLRIRIEGFSNIVRVRIEVDGKDVGVDLRAPPSDIRDGGDWTDVPENRSEAVAAKLEGSKAEAVLLDDNDRVLGRYAWDIRKLDNIPELLHLVHWSCTSLDRG